LINKKERKILRSFLLCLRIQKEIYAAAGIQEYWVVNLKTPHLRVFRDLIQRGYGTELVLTERATTPITVPEIQTEVNRMFIV
jgi:Uma2 family endonuclease